MGSFVQLLLPMTTLIIFTLLYARLINSSLVVKVPVRWFKFGVAFIALGLTNLFVSVYVNDFISIINIRYVLVEITLGVFILSLSNYNKYLYVFSNKIFVVMAVSNLLIILAEQFFWFFDKGLLADLQRVIAPANSFHGLINRPAFGFQLIRPLGLFGGVHAASLFVLISFLRFMALKNLSSMKKNVYWLVFLLFIFSLQSGQTIILSGFAFFVAFIIGKKNIFMPMAILFLFLLPILFLWLSSVGHFDDKQYSMLYIFMNSFEFLFIFPNSECFLFGCSLNNTEILELASSQDGFNENIAYTDNGFISSPLAFGAMFYVVYFIFCFSIFKLKNHSNTKATLSVGSFVLGATIIHYPIGFGAGLYALFLMNFYYLYHYGKLSNNILYENSNSYALNKKE
jgi:hypothetical protein